MADYTSRYSGSEIDDRLDAAGTAYQKPAAGVPESDLSSGVQDKLNAGNTAYQKPSGGIPASDIAAGVIPDVSNFITRAVNDLTNYYLKSETYTKAEVQALIGAIHQFHFEVYASLADVTSPSSNVLYLIGPTGTGADKYEEYVYTTQFVKIGDTSIDLSGYVTTAALNEALATIATQMGQKANKVNASGNGFLAKFDEYGNLAISRLDAYRLFRDLGYNAASTAKTLVAGQTGKYVKCATRVATTNANFAISEPITVDACSEVLIRTGFNPSDGEYAALDLSVISFVHSIERQRKVQAVDGDNNPLYYQLDEDGNPTTETGTTVTGYPVYTTETYTDTIYTPNNEDKYVALPDSGYYVANIPDAAQIVISYKPGVTDTEIIIVKHGSFANIVSQLGMLAFKERLPMVQSLTQLKEGLDGLREIVMENLPNLSSIPTVLGVPFELLGHGAPSASVVPINWPSDLPWDGIPFFPGQLYNNLDASSGGLYHARGNESVSDWAN